MQQTGPASPRSQQLQQQAQEIQQLKEQLQQKDQEIASLKLQVQQLQDGGAAGIAAAPVLAHRRYVRARRAQQDPSLLERQDVLQILLQHPAVCTQQRVLCSLLAASKELAAAVAAGLRAGQLAVLLRPFESHQSKVLRLAAWLAKHGHFVESLTLALPCDDYSNSDLAATAAAVAEGLQKAAAHSGLLLQSFKSSIAGGALLQQLPCSYLTSLDLFWYDSIPDSTSLGHQALPGLTQLRSLSLFGHSADALLPAVAADTCPTALTALSLLKLHVSHVPQLQHLPVQLQQLCLSLQGEHSYFMDEGPGRQAALQLGHLEAVTQLTCSSSNSSSSSSSLNIQIELPLIRGNKGFLVVRQGDVLPPKLLMLAVDAVMQGQPLQQLQCLTSLTCKCGSTKGSLQRVTQLTTLKEVWLGYDSISGYSVSSTRLESAAAVWPTLPIMSLRLEDQRISARTVERMGRLQSLTCLNFHRCHLVASRQQLASALQPLQALQQLQICDVKFVGLQAAAGQPAEQADAAEPAAGQQGQMGDHGEPIAAAGMMALAQAMAALPCLNNLVLDHLLLGSCARQLAAASALTELRLSFCGLDDSDVQALACSTTLAELVVLDLSGNVKLSDDVLPAITAGMRQLKRLVGVPGVARWFRRASRGLLRR